MVRFAPSPIRDLYINDLRVALLNYIVAKQQGKKFVIRIEDTQKDENIEGRDTEIMLILEKFGIIHDFVYHQSQHKNIHQNLALKILKQKRVIKDTKSMTLSVKMEDTISIEDILKGDLKFLPKNVETFKILESENPTKIFASACGDILNKIDFIVREEKELQDSIKERYIQKLLGYNGIKYAHIPSIIEDITIKELLEVGFIPDAIINYLILESYNSPSKEVFYLKDAIDLFKIENISNEPIKFDIDKLKFLNREHLKLMDDKVLSKVFGFADANIGKLAKLYLSRYSTLNELNSKIALIFKPKDFDNEWGEEMKILSDIIFNAPPFEEFNKFKKYLMEQSNLSEDKLSTSLKLLLTNSRDCPELDKIYPLIKSYILEVAS